MESVEEFLRAAVFRRDGVEQFLDPARPSWAKFDAELGYTLNNCVLRDGMDGAYSVYQFEPAGHRKLINHAGFSCRINTYGNSFTHCHQVSDGETWQETLAAHFGEPIRNWGVGGYGVYQAYRRLKREEATALGAPYVVLNIWGDDHLRSLMPWRRMSFFEKWDLANDPVMFHGTPWAHLQFDLGSHTWEERENPYNTPESLHSLCDADHLVERYCNDLVAMLMAATRGVRTMDTRPLEDLAAWLGMQPGGRGDALAPGALRDPETRPEAAKALFDRYGWRATKEIIDRTHALTSAAGKQLMVFFSHTRHAVREACRLGSRRHPDYFDWHPEDVRDHVRALGIPLVDILPHHLADFAASRLTPEEYEARYFIGHYNPRGNQFFAYAVKDALVEWIEPRPFAYRGQDRVIRFEHYLPAGESSG